MGYWKVTSEGRNIKAGPNVIGIKKTLVFYAGRAPRERTQWMMYEYCMNGEAQDSMVVCRLRKKSAFLLNNFPSPGIKVFALMDEDLISHYLKHKMEGDEQLVQIIAEVEIWKDESWTYQVKYKEKYPRGSQSQRATDMGYWKSTRKERNIKVRSNVIGRKRTLVFYTSSPRKAQKTERLMHEFSLNLETQDYDDEDCFAEKIKDDIIKLYKSFMSTTAILVPMVAINSEAKGKSIEPVLVASFQGPADQRVKLNQRKLKTHQRSTIQVQNSGCEHVF